MSLDTQVKKLQQLNVRHLRPLVDRLQLEKEDVRKLRVSRGDVAALQKLRVILVPFIQDFRRTAHALCCRAMKVRHDANFLKNRQDDVMSLQSVCLKGGVTVVALMLLSR